MLGELGTRVGGSGGRAGHTPGYLAYFQRGTRWRLPDQTTGYLWHTCCITKVRNGKLKENKFKRKEQGNENQDEHESRLGSMGWDLISIQKQELAGPEGGKNLRKGAMR